MGGKIESSAYGNALLFTGREWDAETGLYYYRMRYYDPALGRFISPEPYGDWFDPMNLGNGYAYVGNAPWLFVDPFGLCLDRIDEPIPDSGWGFILGEALAGAAWPLSLAGDALRALGGVGANVANDYNPARHIPGIPSHQVVLDADNAVSLSTQRNPIYSAMQGQLEESWDGLVVGAGETLQTLTADLLVGGAVSKIPLPGAGKALAQCFRTQKHHPIPKYLGGREQQELIDLPTSLHTELHSELGRRLRQNGFPRDRGRGGSYRDWDEHFMNNPGSQEHAFDILRDVTQEIDARHGTNITPQLDRNFNLGNYDPR